MRSFIIAGVALCMSLCVVAQSHCYPTNWWIGMKNPNLQLMIRDTGWTTAPSISISYPGVQVLKVQPAGNPHYIFLDLRIGKEARPGTMKIRIKTARGVSVIDYALLPRRAGNGSEFAQGVTSADFIYFLMPDRWSNGDPDNDRVPGMRDQSLNRDSIFLRHGGDMQGIIDHLDYLQGLGVTTLWMTPVLVNDMPNR